jgi:DNA-binding MarR family transcriptional regulator
MVVMIEVVTSVIDEIRLLNNRLIELAEELHSGSGITAPQRAVLEFIHRQGPATVPTIARARGVTRQHIQTISNELRSLDLIESQQNPAHQRSPMIVLTDDGHQTIDRILERERDYLTTHVGDLDANQLRAAAQTLASFRHALPRSTR